MEIKQEVEGFRKEFEIFCAQFHENLIKCGKVATVMTLKQEEELTKYLLTPQDETGSSSTEIASWLENNVFCLVSNEDESHYELHIWNDTQRKVVSIENYFTVLNSMFAETGNISHDKFLKKVNEKYALIPEEVVKYFINNVTKKPKFKVTVQNKENKVYGCKVISYEYLKKRVVKKRILTEIFDKSNGKVLQSRCHEEDPLEEDVFYVEKTEKLSDITNTKFTEVSSTTYSSNQALEIKYLGKTSVAYLPPGEINNQDHLVALSNVIYSVNDFPENTGDIQLEFVIPQKQPTKVFSEIESLLSLIEKTDSGSKPTEPKTLVKTPKKNTDTKTRPNMVITPPGKLAIVANPKTRGATLKHLFNEPLISESKIPSYSELNAAAATDIVETAMEEDDDNDDDDDDDDNGHDFLENVDDLFEDSAAPEVPAQECGREYTSRAGYDYHLQSHKKQKFPCSDCDKVFCSSKTLNTHFRNIHSAEDPSFPRHKCRFCGKVILSQQMLTLHIKTDHADHKETTKQEFTTDFNHKGLKFYKCEKCEKVLQSSNGLYYHLKTHMEPQHQCHLCKQAFKLTAKLNRHLHQVHDLDLSVDQQHGCPDCYKTFLYVSSLRTHRKYHCHPGTIKKKNTGYTIQVSSEGGKKYTCKQCGKEYTTRGGVGHHMNTHLNVEHKCEICSKSYNTSKVLKNHIKMVHEIQELECNICYRDYKTPASLRRHITQVHGSQAPGQRVYYMCPDCELAFTSTAYYAEHIQTLHPERAKHLHCMFCGKEYDKLEKILLHIHLEHAAGDKEKIFSCDECDAKFKSKCGWRTHMNKKHLSTKDGTSN
ncbi:zinc finger and BTB domain-containing protein 17 isoform X6 [Patella vulgata]|uniref:zinc finger and BTB domain-containing protein 17 isoform X6 n=1 Tax=Patella vulgata TaxID=6465 RepID=UPI0021805B3F|nr:zinc finger and BTB domain-containing protein 17 isoform X6 [Patella vulgata]